MKHIVGFFFVLIIFLFSFTHSSYAETASSVASLTDTTKMSSPAASSYVLPYPGILSDNPLYVIKAARDRLVSIFINDPLKRAEFDLLQADKRLNTGIYLVNNKSKQEALIVTTISKGENYFSQAIGELKSAKKQGKDIADMARKLYASSQKHHEVLVVLQKKGSKEFKKGLSEEDKRVSKFQSALLPLLPAN